ncbi:MAG: HlyC/CorC family transporter [Proteobacteria bacterium]|nr:HlyC/CorC family transporter [Pseudomonadota bacterium]
MSPDDTNNQEPPKEPPASGAWRGTGVSASRLKTVAGKVRSILKIRPLSLKESLEEAIIEQEASGETIDPEEKEMLQNVLQFGERTVGDIMIPRSDIIFMQDNFTLPELQKLLAQHPHTRIPVCKETLDHVRGFIHVKDLIAFISNGNSFNVEKIVRKALYVPPSMPLNDLLVQMKNTRTHMAMVIDEYGGTCGLLTMENLVEEIVGEIRDEHDDGMGEPFLNQISKNVYDASARVNITDLEEKLAVKLSKPGVDYDTLGGMIAAQLGRVPSKGEVVKHPAHLEFEIVDADSRRVLRVLIRKQSRRAKKTPQSA